MKLFLLLIACVALFPSISLTAAERLADPGLVAIYADGKHQIFTTAPAPNFVLKDGDSIHPQLGTAFTAEWNGFLTPTETGEYSIGVRFQSGFARVLVNEKPVAQGWAGADDVRLSLLR